MYSLKKLEKIAENKVKGEVKTLDDLKRKLTSWFCFTLNTTPNDSRLLDMTLEELIIFYLSHQIKDNPDYHTQEEEDDYEEWLKSEMGNNYASSEDMIKEHEKLDKEEQQFYDKIKDRYPDKITTDFEDIDKD